MPLAAKILAFLNVLAVGGFIYLASLDYDMRLAWSREVLRHELIIHGLPLDERDPGAYEMRRLDPLRPDLDSQQVLPFAEKTGEPVTTQQQELERVRDALKARLDELAPDARREKLKALYLAQSRTYEERQGVLKTFADPKNKTDDLKNKFLARFDEVIADDESAPDKVQDKLKRRAEAAHLLYNVDPNLFGGEKKVITHLRLSGVIGLKAAVAQAEASAFTLRDIAERTRTETAEDRASFESEYTRQRARLMEMASELDRQKSVLQDKVTLSNSTQEQIKLRQEEIVALEKALQDARDETEKSLAKQSEHEQRLFQAQKKIGDMIEDNRKLEKAIRDLELGRTRGGLQ